MKFFPTALHCRFGLPTYVIFFYSEGFFLNIFLKPKLLKTMSLHLCLRQSLFVPYLWKICSSVFNSRSPFVNVFFEHFKYFKYTLVDFTGSEEKCDMMYFLTLLLCEQVLFSSDFFQFSFVCLSFFSFLAWTM